MPAYVQHATNSASFTSGTSGTVTVTISAAAAGNCLVAAINSSGSNGTPSVSSVKTGSSVENWAKGVELDDASNTACAAIWVDPNTAGGGTTVAVTVAFGATASATNTCEVFVDVFEFSGVASSSPVDKTSTGATGSNSSSWTSGATATTAQASEVAIGTIGATALSGTSTVTGPSSPWVNESTLSGTVVLGGSSFNTYAQSGYQILSATGAVTYSGSTSVSTLWDTVVLTLKGAGSVAGAAALAASGSMTAAGTEKIQGGAALAAVGSLSAAATETIAASASLAAAGAVAASAPTGVAGAAAMTASATLTAAGVTPAPPFPAAPLDLRCELDLAGVQTDVSSYVYQRDGTTPPVSLTRGRADESSQANPGTAAWEWNNRDGRFSPKNPLSPYYGLLGRNTPVRWSVPAQSNYLRSEADSASGASCPDAAGLHVTGDIDIRLDLKLTDYGDHDLVFKWGSSGNFGWFLQTRSGMVQFLWSSTGSDFPSATSTLPLPLGRLTLRVTLSVATGTVTFFAGPAGNADSGTGWTQLGAAVVTGSTSVHASTAVIETAGWFGSVYEAEVRSGIGGTVVAHPVFSAQTAAATSFTDAQSNTWTLNGTAEISARSYRWHGQMSAQPPKWDVTGRDMAVAAQAGGPLRLVGQGQAPVMSPMRRALLAQPGALAPVALWPCEDLAGATMIGSAVGGPLMSVTGGTGDGSVTTAGPAFAASTTFACSNALPTLNGSAWYGQVPAYASNGSIVVRFLMDLGTIPSGIWALVRVITTGTCTEFSLRVNAANELTLAGYNASGTVFSNGPATFTNMPGPVWVSMELQPGAGGTVDYSLVALVPGATTGQELSGSFSGSVGNAAAVYVSPGGQFTDTTVGEISVQSAWESLFALYQPLNAWIGESAGARFARLAGENGWQSRVIGSPAGSAAMGAQAIDTLGNLLQSCEDADRGQIFEPRQALALGYRTLASMCGQEAALALDYSQSEPGGADGGGGDSGLDPTYDDQLTRNDWTLSRVAGSGAGGATYQLQLDDGSAMSVSNPPVGVGDYADTKSVNVQYDSQLPDLAGWMVHVGVVDEARWPAIPINLARPQTAALYWDALDTDIGDLVEIDDAPGLVVVDPVRQLAFQQTEQLGGKHYAMAFNAVPASPYTTIILDDPVYGRVDTDGSTLSAGASATAASLSVATDAGFPLWTTAAADFPFDIGVAGERMTVTNITGSSSPQTFTVTRSVNGVSKSQSSGADVRLWFPPILALA